jgi:hypothetical protein
MANVYETTARNLKTHALVDEIDRLCRRSDIDPVANAADVGHMLAQWPEHAWAQVALACGKRPPSDETRAMVIARYVSRVEMIKFQGRTI